MSGRLERWRWSIFDGRHDIAGSGLGHTAKEVIEAVAHEHGIQGEPLHTSRWRTGGWAQYPTHAIVVTIADPKPGRTDRVVSKGGRRR